VRRNSSYVVVALAAALVGGLVAVLTVQAAGLTGGDTSTVYVPTSASDLRTSRDEPISRARLLPANRFDPAGIYAARSPGVVTVFAVYDEPDDHESQGSGFITSPAGYILTSAHVVIDTSTSKTVEARNLYVGFKDRDRIGATLVGWDVYDDVALLKVDPSAHALAPVPLGDSSRVRAGDPVAAMGSPFGNEDSITTGVVSAIRRPIASLTSVYKVVDAIQIDAPITHGNSGGPLFDARGRVIGINAQIRTETGGAEGVGFAIPINAARRSMTQLAANGRVVYAYLGVTTEDLTPTLARHLHYRVLRGAIVGEVRGGSPAAKAGVHGGKGDESFNGQSVTPGGDVIVAIDGQPVQTADDVVRMVGANVPGQTITLTIVRGDERKSLQAKLGARPDAPDTNP